MVVQCPQCKGRYRVDPSKAGQRAVARIKCPKCAHVFPVDLVPMADAPALAPPAPSPPDARPKVLVVDDSKFFRELILDVLSPLGLDCLTAGDAEEALDLLQRERPRLLMLDLNLPGKSGYDLIRELRAGAAFSGLRILAMSGVFRKEEDVAAVEVAGADEFITKSFKPEQLQLRVQKLLQD